MNWYPVQGWLNPFSPRQLSTPNFSLHKTYKIKHLVIRNCELIKQRKLVRIKRKILSNLFNEKYRLKLGEFNNTTGTERANHTTLRRPGKRCRQTLSSLNDFGFLSKNVPYWALWSWASCHSPNFWENDIYPLRSSRRIRRSTDVCFIVHYFMRTQLPG